MVTNPKDKQREYSQKYRKIHKGETSVCECGIDVGILGMSKHLNSKRHNMAVTNLRKN